MSVIMMAYITFSILTIIILGVQVWGWKRDAIHFKRQNDIMFKEYYKYRVQVIKQENYIKQLKAELLISDS